jgi:hypothetical protein
MESTKLSPWHVRDLPQSTRNKITACKGLLGVKTIPEALDKMADITLASLQKK